jgi:hypothetical protein
MINLCITEMHLFLPQSPQFQYCSKVQVQSLFLDSGLTFSCKPLWKLKNEQFTHCQHTVKKVNFPVSKGWYRRTPRNVWTRARLRPRRACTQSRAQERNSKGIAKPIPCGLALFRTRDLSPLLALLAACSFPQQMFQVPSISKTLGSLLQLHPTFTASCVTFSEHDCRDFYPATNCLTSQVFLWNLSGILHDPITLALCMPAKPVLCEWCHSLLPAEALAMPPWAMTTAASKCLGG